MPAKVGVRTTTVEFSCVAGEKPTDLKTVATESQPLTDFVRSLLLAGQIKTNMEGVSQIGENRYRAVVSYPVPDDGEPLPADVILPKPRSLQAPIYPFELRRKGIVGGAVVRLHIDHKARVKNVELVSSSDPLLGPAAVEAIWKWKFAQPAMRNNQPIEVTMLQLVVFETETMRAPVRWQIAPEPKLQEVVISGSYVPLR